MKKTALLLIIFSILSCKDDSKNISKEIDNKTEIKNAEPLPKFSSVREILADANDFDEEVGTLKFISEDKNNFHVQISKPILEDDLESVKNEIVKRDIVYVAFQIFAQTEMDNLTITSIPVDYENPKKYIDKYKLTVKIDRDKAKSILKKYLNTENFSILYERQNSMWLPSRSFSILKFDKLEEVYNDISRK